jgi:serine/threonine protein kinase
MNPDHLCMGCMSEKGDAQVCGICGWEEGTPTELPVQLSPRTVLGEKYLLGKVLGQGGFGITYLAWDLLLSRKLAIKEYFPREICSRGRDDRTVQPLSQRSQRDFGYGLAKFVEEGRNLARFRDYPGIVSLLDFFEANGTAYIVMAYMEGMTFKQYLEEQGGKIGFNQALNVLNPVMDALREVHRIGMLHRDISPDNIYLNQDRQVKILDFGATRYAMREQSQNLTVLIKPGYAPLEQYSSGGKQGPWTDVYAVGATFYRAVIGRAPSEAPDRLAQDDLIPPSKLNISIPPESESALLKALAVHWQSRFQSMEDFQKSVMPVPQPEPGPVVIAPPIPSRSFNPVLLVVAGLFLLASLAFSALWVSARGQLKSAESKVDDLTRQLLSNEIQKQAERNKPPNSQPSDDLKKQVDELTKQRDGLQAKVQSLGANLNTAQSQRDSLKNEVDSLNQQVSNLRAQLAAQPKPPASPQQLNVPIFEIYSSDREGNNLQGPSAQFSSRDLRWVLCRIGGPSPVPATIEVRFIAPGGAKKITVPAPVIPMNKGTHWGSQAMWGNDQPGTFQRGVWKIEVWSGQKEIRGESFRVN